MPENRLPLVLLSGSLCDASMWHEPIEALTDMADAHVIALSGFDSVEDMAAHVLVSAPEGVFALAGFSLGGFVALEVIRRAPDRVSHLALLDSSASPDHPDNAVRREGNIAAFDRDPAPVLDAFADLTRGQSTPDSIFEAVRGTMHARGQKDYIAQQRAIMTRPDARPTLSVIKCPTLILCGSEDRATPPAGHREIAGSIPGARYVELPGVGHMTTLEAPGEVAQAMRQWLSRKSDNTMVESSHRKHQWE